VCSVYPVGCVCGMCGGGIGVGVVVVVRALSLTRSKGLFCCCALPPHFHELVLMTLVLGLLF